MNQLVPLRLLIALTCQFSNSNALAHEPIREPASVRYPHVRNLSDADEIFQEYEVLLQLVREAAGPKAQKQISILNRKYRILKKHYPERAAKFLKNLHHEIDQKIFFVRADPRKLTSSSAVIRKVVRKYLTRWTHEVDEMLFVAVASKYR